MLTIKITEDSRINGKVAEAEVHFAAGPLQGLRLIGFGIWERRTGGYNVTFPARQYSVNGDRRSFALLRPIDDSAAQDRIRDMILDAYRQHTAPPIGRPGTYTRDFPVTLTPEQQETQRRIDAADTTTDAPF